jgi:hypothetical protein
MEFGHRGDHTSKGGYVWPNLEEQPVPEGFKVTPLPDKVQMQVRIKPYYKQALERAAEERCVSISFLVERAVINLLDNLVPINQLTKQKEADNERAANQGGTGDSGVSRFDQYQRGL